MALAQSPLSQICRAIRAYLDGQINAPDRSKVSVVLATPAESAPSGAGDAEHRLNLFFFRFEPSGLFPDIQPGETSWLRTFCLITPFAAEEDSVGAGENDLRLVGEVIRIFHEEPVHLLTVDGEAYHMQVMLQPLALDQLNQLWSTQGETIYRPSALFEMSLVPVLPVTRTVPAPLAGGLGLDVRPSLEQRAPTIAGAPPQVPVMTPDIAREDWVPAIAFVYGEHCALSLSFLLGSQALADFTPRVWLAGRVGETLSLCWETWDAASGWQRLEPAEPASVSSPGIDPDAAAAADTAAVTLPFRDHPGQMLLYAERSYTRAGGSASLTVRSNPLLLSLHGG